MSTPQKRTLRIKSIPIHIDNTRTETDAHQVSKRIIRYINLGLRVLIIPEDRMYHDFLDTLMDDMYHSFNDTIIQFLALISFQQPYGKRDIYEDVVRALVIATGVHDVSKLVDETAFVMGAPLLKGVE